MAPESSSRGPALRGRLAAARLQVLFTPGLCAGDPERTLAEVVGAADVVQVRCPGEDGRAGAASESLHWCERALELADRCPSPPLVLVNDRVDVARVLLERGLAGVHLGQDDMPVAEARELLGPEPLIGLSTHGPGDVARAGDLPVDYLGYGPIFPTATKGYERGLGPEAAWIASQATDLPVFPIGGIDEHVVNELARVGRAAVSSAVLGSHEPGRAARFLRDALAAGEGD